MHYWSNTLPWDRVQPYVQRIITQGWKAENFFRLAGSRRDGKTFDDPAQ
jgi:hypothetical protein